MEEPDDIKLTPFKDELKSPFNWIVLIIGIAFLVDLLGTGSMAKSVALFQMKLMGVDTTVKNFQVVSVFGIFPSVEAYAKRLDIAVSGICLVLAGFYFLRGLWRTKSFSQE
jgi:uncharacterized membrane protein